MSDPTSTAASCGQSALQRLVDRTRHAASGARMTVERCPEACPSRALRGAAVVGGVAALGGFLIRRSPLFVAAAGLGGAIVGALGSRYHLSFDWDPDRAFGGGAPPADESGPRSEPDADGKEPF